MWNLQHLAKGQEKMKIAMMEEGKRHNAYFYRQLGFSSLPEVADEFFEKVFLSRGTRGIRG